METNLTAYIGAKDAVSPTRLEGMETFANFSASMLMLTSPTRLEGMETYRPPQRFPLPVIVSDPP